MAAPGPRNDLSDVTGLHVGHAGDARILTGTTVILAERPVAAACEVAGGGPGTRETDLLDAGRLVQAVDAVVLSGGSAYGLAAADGVVAELGRQGRGFGLIDRPGVPRTPIVPAAILYDLANGGDKAWGGSPPYEQLGRAAFADALAGSLAEARVDAKSDTEAANPVDRAADEAATARRHGRLARQGAVGAGLGARAGACPGGVGMASLVTEEGYTVGALAAVNCFGSVLMPGTDCYWAWPFEIDGEFGGRRPPAHYRANPEDWGAAKANPQPGENTTLACVATDADLTASECQRLAAMAMAGFARAIRPVFAPFDGDVVFALATQTRPVTAESGRAYLVARLGELAAACLARSIARGVHLAGGAH